jgi:hypothetical protein
MTVAAIATTFAGIYPKRGFVRPEDSAWNVVGPTGPLKPSDAVWLSLDAMISEAPKYTATPTQSQVEDGETISDHVTLRPVKLDVHGIVSDTPVSVQGLINTFSGAGSSPSAKAHQFLLKLYKDRVPFDFVGGLAIYKSMVLTAYEPTNTVETGAALKFSCTMEQILTVSTVSLSVAKPKQSAPKKSVGSQTMGAIPDSQTPVVDATGDTLNAHT